MRSGSFRHAELFLIKQVDRLKLWALSYPVDKLKEAIFFSPTYSFFLSFACANKKKASFPIHNSVFSGYAGRRGAAQSECVSRSCRRELCNPQQQSQPPVGKITPAKTDSGRYLPYQGGRRRGEEEKVVGRRCRGFQEWRWWYIIQTFAHVLTLQPR